MFSRVDEARAASRLVNLPVSETLRPQCPSVNFRSGIRHEPKFLQVVRSSIVFASFLPPSFYQQISNPVLHLVVIPFTRMLPPNHSPGIDYGLSWPVLISVEFPCSVLAVDCDWVSYSKPFHRTGNVLRQFFELKLGSVDPDQNERVSGVFLVEHFHVGQRSNAIYTAVGPEVEE